MTIKHFGMLILIEPDKPRKQIVVTEANENDWEFVTVFDGERYRIAVF